MNPSIPSKTLIVVTACLVGVPGAPGRAAADKPVPHVAAVLLRDFDLSHNIPAASGPRRPQTLKPRRTPGYEALRSALWSSRPNGATALLADGADPNAKDKDGNPILHYAVRLG